MCSPWQCERGVLRSSSSGASAILLLLPNTRASYEDSCRMDVMNIQLPHWAGHSPSRQKWLLLLLLQH